MEQPASFRDAMRLTRVDDGAADADSAEFTGDLTADWTIGPKVHGGAMLALCANAARTAHGAGRQPVAVSASFLSAPDPGPMRLRTTVRKHGRRVGVVEVELAQGERAAVHAVVTLGEFDQVSGEVPTDPLLSVNPVVSLMTPEPPPGLASIGPGHPMEHIVHLARGCDIRPALNTLAPRSDGGPPVIEMWVRPKTAAPDVLFALLCGDVSAPVTMAINRPGWAPTVQLTAYLRAIPADGWLRVICTTTEIGRDWFDEDHIVVDCRGRIVVQTRQLAMVPTG